MGSYMSGGTTIALYDTLGPDAFRFVIEQTQLTTICTSKDLIENMLKLKADDPEGKMQSFSAIVVYESDVGEDLKGKA